MNQKNAEYIALYSLVFGVILVFGILIRQFVLSKGIDAVVQLHFLQQLLY